MAFAEPFSARISQPSVRANTMSGTTVARAIGIGRARAAFFGTSSPKSIENSVATTSAPNADTGPSSGSNRCASAGSARYPVSSAAIVMPTCAPESWNDSSRRARRTVRAARSPVSACRPISARSTVTSENSAATNPALATVSSTNASSGSSVVVTTGAFSPAGAAPCARPEHPVAPACYADRVPQDAGTPVAAQGMSLSQRRACTAAKPIHIRPLPGAFGLSALGQSLTEVS